MNLVIKDIAKLLNFAPTCRKAWAVISYFNQNMRALGKLQFVHNRLDKTASAIPKPSDTRWYSYYLSYNALMRSKQSLRVRALARYGILRACMSCILTVKIELRPPSEYPPARNSVTLFDRLKH